MRANATAVVAGSLSICHLVQPFLLLNYRGRSSIDASKQVRGRSSDDFQECVCSPCGQQYLRFTRSPMLHETKCSLSGCAAAFLLLLLFCLLCLLACYACLHATSLPSLPSMQPPFLPSLPCNLPFVPYDRRLDGTLPPSPFLAYLLARFLACLLTCSPCLPHTRSNCIWLTSEGFW